MTLHFQLVPPQHCSWGCNEISAKLWIINKAYRWTRCTWCTELPSHHAHFCISSSRKGNMASPLILSFSPSLFRLSHITENLQPLHMQSPDTLLVMDAVLSSDTLAASHYHVQEAAGGYVLIQSQRVQSEERVMRLCGGAVPWSSQCFTQVLWCEANIKVPL